MILTGIDALFKDLSWESEKVDFIDVVVRGEDGLPVDPPGKLNLKEK